MRHKLATGDGVVRQAAVAGTTGGSLVAALALWGGEAYTVLRATGEAMALEVEHVGGLNPVAFR